MIFIPEEALLEEESADDSTAGEEGTEEGEDQEESLSEALKLSDINEDEAADQQQ